MAEVSSLRESSEDSDSDFSQASGPSYQLSVQSEHSSHDDAAPRPNPDNCFLEGDLSLLEVNSGSSSKFTLFPSLPLELRAKIWELSLPGSRLVEIRYLNLPCHFPAPRLPSSVLHVSQESREVTLRHYKLLYRLSSPLPLIYIDPEVDALFVNEHVQRLDEVFSELDPDVLHSLGHIVLESMMMFVFSNIVGRFVPFLLRLSSLRRITLILPPTEPEHEAGYTLLFELLKVPMAKWPDTVERGDEQLFTQRALEYCRYKRHLDDPQWLKTGFNKITKAVEDCFRNSPGRTIPQVDLKGVRRI